MSEQTTPSGHPLIDGTASWLHRVGALFADWFASSGVALAVNAALGISTSDGIAGLTPEERLAIAMPLLVFFVQTAFGVALVGASFGQYLLRINVRRLDGRPLSLFRALERQLLVVLVIPPLVFRSDGRGLHDILTGSAAFPKTPYAGS